MFESECPKCRKGIVKTTYSYESGSMLRRECLKKTCLGCGYFWEEATEDAENKYNNNEGLSLVQPSPLKQGDSYATDGAIIYSISWM